MFDFVSHLLSVVACWAKPSEVSAATFNPCDQRRWRALLLDYSLTSGPWIPGKRSKSHPKLSQCAKKKKLDSMIRWKSFWKPDVEPHECKWLFIICGDCFSFGNCNKSLVLTVHHHGFNIHLHKYLSTLSDNGEHGDVCLLDLFDKQSISDTWPGLFSLPD